MGGSGLGCGVTFVFCIIFVVLGFGCILVSWLDRCLISALVVILSEILSRFAFFNVSINGHAFQIAFLVINPSRFFVLECLAYSLSYLHDIYQT